ncbi:MAG: HAMP domain-containing histidine kinase [Phycisphaeraceae bacterium]|nr:MAG: HAMP domain-containing histidine kinase [Phycisphaeraceae bacterium]
MPARRPNDDRPGPSRHAKAGRPDPTNPAIAPDMLANVGVLIHEMSNLLDGSLRCLSLARRTLCANDAWASDPQATRVQRQLDAASTALEQMAGLVHAALQGPSLALGSPMLAGTRGITLGEALDHAAEVVRPRAAELGVQVSVAATDAARAAPAGPLYLVLLNGIKNAVESIARAEGGESPPGGLVHVEARTADLDPRSARPRPMIALEITDDGAGPPKGAALARVFEHGFSLKPGGMGMGLAVCKSIVEHTGGSIELARRRERSDRRRPGAVLRVAYPIPFAGDIAEAA